MSTSTDKVSAFSHVDPQTTEPKPIVAPSVYIVVEGDKVVQGCNSAEEALKFTDEHRNGTIYGKLSDAPNGKKRDVMPEENPVAHAIWQLSSEEIERARSLISGTVGWVESYHNRGIAELARPDKSTGRRYRRATNLECADVFFTVKVRCYIDLRFDLFEELTECMREQAERFTMLANEFSSMEDTRNVFTINEVIEDKRFLEKLHRRGMEIGYKGEICARLESQKEREDKEHIYAAFDDRRKEMDDSAPSYLQTQFYGVVDPDSVQNPTRSLASATGFARGRGGQSIVIAMVDAPERTAE